MTEKDIFRSKEEEAKQIAAEIRELKEILRDVSGKLSRIETRMKRVFPEAFAPPPRPRALVNQGTSTLSPQQALQIYDELVELMRAGHRENIQQRLTNIDVADLLLMVRELGVSRGKKKPSRKSLTGAILARINESVMLSSHVTREPSPSTPGEQGPDKSGSESK